MHAIFQISIVMKGRIVNCISHVVINHFFDLNAHYSACKTVEPLISKFSDNSPCRSNVNLLFKSI